MQKMKNKNRHLQSSQSLKKTEYHLGSMSNVVGCYFHQGKCRLKGPLTQKTEKKVSHLPLMLSSC